MELTTVWFSLIAILWIGYFALEGFDFGVGMLLPVLGQGREGAPGALQHHRPGLGRQRGVGAGGRRRDLRRLPRVVRHAVQRLLPAAAADPGRADRAQPRLRLPRQARRRHLARPLGRRGDLRLLPAGGPVGRRVRQHRRRRADRREQGVHRQPVHAAQPVRAARRAGHHGALPHPRRDVRGPQDRRRHPAPRPRALGQAGPGHGGRWPWCSSSGRWPSRAGRCRR